MQKLILAFALIVAALPASAQETETIVVTGSRDSYSLREKEAVPYAVVIRRADHLINRIYVTDDTRDSKLRHEEMRQTLKALLQEARRNSRISLSLGDKTLTDFTEKMIEEQVLSASYGESSRMRIVVKTAISGGDSFDSASGRIIAFVKHIPSFGRSEIKTDAAWDLTIVNPEQYHGIVVTRIAAEAKQSAAKFGSDYGAIVDGLQQPLLWYRAGDLNLALYIRYTMVIAQKGTGKVVVQRRNQDD